MLKIGDKPYADFGAFFSTNEKSGGARCSASDAPGFPMWSCIPLADYGGKERKHLSDARMYVSM
jgi:hypothetical protein